jgi:putative transposase
VCRYVELNPVRASVVDRAEAWPWSSYLAHVGVAPAPLWLDTSGLHGYLLGREPRHAADRRRAASRYAALVTAGRDVELWSDALRQQIFLGDEGFVERMQAHADPVRRASTEVPAAQRRKAGELDRFSRESSSRDEAVRRAHVEGGLTMTDIARGLGLSVSRVSRLTARAVSRGSQQEAKGKT